MAKLRCPCGDILSNSAWPNETQGWLVTCFQLEVVDEDNGVMDVGRDIWECKSCGRLAFSYPGKDDNTVKWYSPDDGKPGNLNGRSET